MNPNPIRFIDDSVEPVSIYGEPDVKYITNVEVG